MAEAAASPVLNSPSPEERVMGVLLGIVQGRCLIAAAELRIADALASGPQQIEELAASTGTNADNLFRLLRALETIDVFKQTSPGVFANTPVSDCLRRGVAGSQWAFVNLLAPGLGLWDGYTQMTETIRTGSTALFDGWGHDLWEHYRRNPAMAEIFKRSHALNDSTDDPCCHGGV